MKEYEDLRKRLEPRCRRIEAPVPAIPRYLELDRTPVLGSPPHVYDELVGKAARNVVEVIDQLPHPEGAAFCVFALWELLEMVLGGWELAQTSATLLPRWWDEDEGWQRWALYSPDTNIPENLPWASFEHFAREVRRFPDERRAHRWDVLLVISGTRDAAYPPQLFVQSNTWLLEYIRHTLENLLLLTTTAEVRGPEFNPMEAFHSLFGRMVELVQAAYSHTEVDLADRWLGRAFARIPVRNIDKIERFGLR